MSKTPPKQNNHYTDPYEFMDHPEVRLVDATLHMEHDPALQETIFSAIRTRSEPFVKMASRIAYDYAATTSNDVIFELLDRLDFPYPIASLSTNLKSRFNVSDPLVNAAHSTTQSSTLMHCLKKIKAKTPHKHQLVITQAAFNAACYSQNYLGLLHLIRLVPELITPANAQEFSAHIIHEPGHYHRKGQLSSFADQESVQAIFNELIAVVESAHGPVQLSRLRTINNHNSHGYMHPVAHWAAEVPVYNWVAPEIRTEALFSERKNQNPGHLALPASERSAHVSHWHYQFMIAQQPSDSNIKLLQNIVKTMDHTLIEDALLYTARDSQLKNIKSILQHDLQENRQNTHPMLTHFILQHANNDNLGIDSKTLASELVKANIPKMSPLCSSGFTYAFLIAHYHQPHHRQAMENSYKHIQPFLDSKSVSFIDQYLASKCFPKGSDRSHSFSSKNTTISEEWNALKEAALLGLIQSAQLSTKPASVQDPSLPSRTISSRI